jgi:hypothetical protein
VNLHPAVILVQHIGARNPDLIPHCGNGQVVRDALARADCIRLSDGSEADFLQQKSAVLALNVPGVNEVRVGDKQLNVQVSIGFPANCLDRPRHSEASLDELQAIRVIDVPPQRGAASVPIRWAYMCGD